MTADNSGNFNMFKISAKNAFASVDPYPVAPVAQKGMHLKTSNFRRVVCFEHTGLLSLNHKL